MLAFLSAPGPCQPPYALLSMSAALSNVPKPLHRKGSARVTVLSICYCVYKDMKEHGLVVRERSSVALLLLRRGRYRWGEVVVALLLLERVRCRGGEVIIAEERSSSLRSCG